MGLCVDDILGSRFGEKEILTALRELAIEAERPRDPITYGAITRRIVYNRRLAPIKRALSDASVRIDRDTKKKNFKQFLDYLPDDLRSEMAKIRQLSEN